MPTKTTMFAWPRYDTGVGLSGQAALDGSYTGPRVGGYLFRENTFTGVSNPNWRSQIARSVNATTNASGEKYQCFGIGPQYYCLGYVNSAIPTPVNARRQSICALNVSINLPQAGSAEETANINAARTKFAKKVEKALTQFSGGVFCAELRETLHMIRRPGQSLFREIFLYLGTVQKNARKLKRQPISKREQWLSNTWLEFSFGWAPLLNDLDDARAYLQRRQDALFQDVLPVKAGSSTDVLRSETNMSYSVGVGTIRCRERSVDTYLCVYAGAISSRALGTSLIDASAMGLSARSFVPTLWEIIPWSFVIDYFSNIGEVLTAWSNQNVALVWGRETKRGQRKTDFIDQRASNSLVKVLDANFIPSSQLSIGSRFTRAPLASPPLPAVQYELPGFGVKWINLVALANVRQSLGAYRLWI